MKLYRIIWTPPVDTSNAYAPSHNEALEIEWVGTKTEASQRCADIAKTTGEKQAYLEIDVPTDKAGLIEFLEEYRVCYPGPVTDAFL